MGNYQSEALSEWMSVSLFRRGGITEKLNAGTQLLTQGAVPEFKNSPGRGAALFKNRICGLFSLLGISSVVRLKGNLFQSNKVTEI